MSAGTAEPAIAGVLRRILLAIFVAAALGTLAELLLLGHYEDRWQLVPLGLLGAGPLVALWHSLRPSVTTLRAFRALTWCFVAGGLIGTYLHYTGNAEFELEMYPSRAGLELFWESLRGATPTLAPAGLAWLGLIGLAYAFRHPGLNAED